MTMNTNVTMTVCSRQKKCVQCYNKKINSIEHCQFLCMLAWYSERKGACAREESSTQAKGPARLPVERGNMVYLKKHTQTYIAVRERMLRGG